MFGFLSNLKKKDGDPDPADGANPPPGGAPAAQDSPTPSPHVIDFPISAFMDGLPKAIASRLQPNPSNASLFRIPEEIILGHLAKGVVRFPYQELRKYADPGLAPVIPEESNTLVEIPLSQVFPRLSPGSLRRKTNQRRVEIPADAPAICAKQTFAPLPTSNTGQSAPLTAAPATPAEPPKTDGRPPAPEAAPAPAHPANGILVPVHVLEKSGVQPLAAAVAGLKGHFVVPTTLVESGLRGGRIQAPWSQARDWWVPGGPTELLPSIEPGQLVEFPLVYLAPEFIRATRRAAAETPPPAKPLPASAAARPSGKPLPANPAPADLSRLAARPSVESLLLVSGGGAVLGGGSANPLLATAPQILRGLVLAMGAGPSASALVSAGERQLALVPAGGNYLVVLSKPKCRLDLAELEAAAHSLG